MCLSNINMSDNNINESAANINDYYNYNNSNDSEIIYKDVQLLPKQLEFLNSTEKEVMASGGFGSSKSYMLCYKTVLEALKPNNQVLLVRKTLTSLKRSTLMVLLGGENPILPNGSYKYNKVENFITLNGSSSIIWLSGLDDAQKIRSMNLGCVCLDEGSEVTEKEYLELLYRLRLQNGCRQIFTATNPSNQGHHLYKRFFLEKSMDRKVITMSSLDNTFLPEDYINSLKEMTGTLYKKYVEGQWCNMEGLVFDNFNRETHIKRCDLDGYEEYYMGIDIGYKDPTVILMVGRRGDRLYALEEVYKREMLMDQIIKYVVNLNDKYVNPTILLDPSCALVKAQLENIGLKVEKTNNDINIGINRMRNYFNIRNDSPDLIINDTCTSLIMEIENYSYKEGTDKPIDKNNHEIDCFRYIVNHIEDKKSVGRPGVCFSGEDDEF